MKVLHTADWHIGQYKGPMAEGKNLRFEDIRNCLEALTAQAEAEKPDLTIIAGDIFNQAEVQARRVSSEVLLAEKAIRKLSAASGDVVVLRGTPNHDGSGQIELLAEMFRDTGNVHIVTTPKVVHTQTADVACVPGFDKGEFRAKYPGLSAEEENITWTEAIGQILLGLRLECTLGKPAILTAHYTTPGANTESGQSSFFANFEPVIPSNVLHTANYDAVMLGHIHRPQLVYGFDNVYYSGAVNALNFNDEGQDRGFYIHEFDRCRLINSTFRRLPYRQFITLKWSPDDVTDYLRDPEEFFRIHQTAEKVRNRIVRVIYQCTPEQKQAIGIPLLQGRLYGLGAFYVSELLADTDVEVTNKDLLSEEADPLLNLRRWLEEKKFPDPDKITELGEPIIRQAQMLAVTSKAHGVFRPVHIAVKNYRNYAAAEFDFNDVSFCTINGQNGAGKSSLFMDAIIDALYEEPREGDLKGWIRATEEARSGSIEFIFDIGKNRFRVTRTRVKSGRATLNLSQLSEDGQTWENRSKEKYADTQEAIINTVGMDSLTFRSCALIMQDQYGLFLQAKKEDRVAVLANLLGLGIYRIMEKIARDKLADVRRSMADAVADIKVHEQQIASKGDPEKELHELDAQLAALHEDIAKLSEKHELLKEKAASYERALAEYTRASEEAKNKREELDKNRCTLEDARTQLAACDVELEEEATITEKAQAYRDAERKKEALFPGVVHQGVLKANAEEKQEEAASIELDILSLNRKVSDLEARAELLKGNDLPEDIEEKLSELEESRIKLEDFRRKQVSYTSIQMDFLRKKALAEQEIQVAEKERDSKCTERDRCKKQELYLRDSGCPSPETATCRFLAQAKADAGKISDLDEQIRELTVTISEKGKILSALTAEMQEKLGAIGYDQEAEGILKSRINMLTVYETMRRQQEEAARAVSRLEGEIESTLTTIEEHRKRAEKAKSEALALHNEAAALDEKVSAYTDAVYKATELKKYELQRANLPVIKERRAHYMEMQSVLAERIDADDKALSDLLIRMTGYQKDVMGYDPGITQELKEIERMLSDLVSSQDKLQLSKGALQQKIEDITSLREEVDAITKKSEELSQVIVRYDALKQAFSQDGVPHQIIRNIIPHITDTANSILGSMTGGTMGVEFVLDKVIKGSGNEKAALDVFIDEYGKTKLPYAAKSGGEKVKSSLAIILALSEIKATAAGIQLGMLFIDEPPFLDAEGTQAYVDALETIRARYPDIKVMAITHDDEFKARFSQSVTVTKDANGSHVHWD